MFSNTQLGRSTSDIALFFGFEYSPAFPGKETDTSGARAIAELLPRIGSRVTPVVISKSAEWLSENCDSGGIYLEKSQLESELAFDNTAFVDHDLFLSILGELEVLALRRDEYFYLNTSKLRTFLESKIRFWFGVFKSYNIHFFISSNVPHRLDDYVAYRLAKASGTPTLFFYRFPIVSGILGRLVLYSDIEGSEEVIALNNLDMSERVSGGCKYEDANLGELPADLGTIYNKCVLSGFGLSDVAWKEKSSVKKKGKGERKHVVSPRQRLLKKITRKAIKKYFSLMEYMDYKRNAEKPDLLQHDYFLLFLHYQPEASSRPLGGVWANQINLIKTLAKSLPEGSLLYIKEHPKQQEKPGFRGGFYSDISEIENVVLIDSSEDHEGNSALGHCMGVITITGTVAFEAMLTGKPALVMGQSPLWQCNGVYHPESQAGLSETLSGIYDGTLVGASKEDIRNYFEWLDEHSFVGYLEPYVAPNIEHLIPEDKNVRVLASIMLKWIETLDWSKGVKADD